MIDKSTSSDKKHESEYIDRVVSLNKINGADVFPFNFQLEKFDSMMNESEEESREASERYKPEEEYSDQIP